MRILKSLSLWISSPLSQIINESFQCGTFPYKMKLAKVLPLFKKGCPITESICRPISLLSVFSKITEKVMYKSVYTFLGKHELLYTLQLCFMVVIPLTMPLLVQLLCFIWFSKKDSVMPTSLFHLKATTTN